MYGVKLYVGYIIVCELVVCFEVDVYIIYKWIYKENLLYKMIIVKIRIFMGIDI